MAAVLGHLPARATEAATREFGFGLVQRSGVAQTGHHGFQPALPRSHLARGVLAKSVPKLHQIVLLRGQSTLGMMGLHRTLKALQHQAAAFNASVGHRLQARGPFRQHLQFLLAIRKQLHDGLGGCAGPHIGHEINQTLILFVPNALTRGSWQLRPPGPPPRR